MATGDGTYITVEHVRTNAGFFDTTTLTDTRLGYIISAVEAETEKMLNVPIVPETKIEVLDGEGTDRVFLTRHPVLRLNSIKSDDSTITPAYVEVYPGGMLVLGESAEVGSFVVKQNSVIVSYLWGYMDDTSTSTTLSSASSSGTSVALSVASETGFSADDWVRVYGTDGNIEVAQVSSTASGTITVDSLSRAHASGSTVMLLQINQTLKQYMIVEAGIRLIVAAIGSTSTDVTSQSLGDFAVTKGEPYTQWRETLKGLRIRKQELKKKINIGIVVR